MGVNDHLKIQDISSEPVKYLNYWIYRTNS